MRHTIEIPGLSAAAIASAAISGTVHVTLSWTPFGPQDRLQYVGTNPDDPTGSPPDPMPLLYANDSTPLQLVVDIQEPDFELMASDHAGHHVRVFRFGSDHKEKFALCLIRFGD